MTQDQRIKAAQEAYKSLSEAQQNRVNVLRDGSTSWNVGFFAVIGDMLITSSVGHGDVDFFDIDGNISIDEVVWHSRRDLKG